VKYLAWFPAVSLLYLVRDNGLYVFYHGGVPRRPVTPHLTLYNLIKSQADLIIRIECRVGYWFGMTGNSGEDLLNSFKLAGCGGYCLCAV